MARLLLSFLAALVIVLPVSGKDPDWRTGKLVSVQTEPVQEFAGGTSWTEHIWTYAVDADGLVYHGRIQGRKSKGDFGLIVSDPVTFAAEEKKLYLKDSKGKKKELDLVKKTRKES